ncbi:NAD-binding protein [bacterium]|nr:NAD-binding protein [bacterium]
MGEFWNSTGLLIGETSYDNVITASGSEQSRWVYKQLAWNLARVSGLLFIFFAYLILAFEWLIQPFRQIRVWFWAPSIKYLWRLDYVLVCGLGWKGREISLKLLQQGKRVVVIEKDADNPVVSESRERGAVVFIGNSTDKSLLNKAGATRAHQIYIITGSDELNCRTVSQIDQIHQHRESAPCLNESIDFKRTYCRKCTAKENLHCYVDISGYRSRMFLENRKWNSRIFVYCFTTEELIVREKFKSDIWKELTESSMPHSAFFIFGFSRIGREILLHLLRSLHLRNEQQREIVVLCHNSNHTEGMGSAEEVQTEFLSEFPCLKPSNELTAELQLVTNKLFPNLKFVDLPASNSELLDDDFVVYENIKPGWQSHIFYCLDDGVKSQVLSELIQPKLDWLQREVNSDPLSIDEVIKSKKVATKVTSHVYYNYPEQEISGNTKNTSPKAFGSYREYFYPEFITNSYTETKAQTINVFFNTYFGDNKAKRTLRTLLEETRNKSDRESALNCFVKIKWDECQEWERESNRQVVDHIPVKLALFGYTLDTDGKLSRNGEFSDETNHEDIFESLEKLFSFKKTDQGQIIEQSDELVELAEIEHRRWCAERLLGGWLPIESQKEIDRWHSVKEFKTISKNLLRRHVDLVPFNKLDKDEKTKDYLIISCIPRLLRGTKELLLFSLEVEE